MGKIHINYAIGDFILAKNNVFAGYLRIHTRENWTGAFDASKYLRSNTRVFAWEKSHANVSFVINQLDLMDFSNSMYEYTMEKLLYKSEI